MAPPLLMKLWRQSSSGLAGFSLFQAQSKTE
jgi:hypothetical protein